MPPPLSVEEREKAHRRQQGEKMGEALRKRGGPIVELKLVLFGQVGSGKTRLLNRFVYARKPMSDRGGHDRAKGNANSNGNDGEEEEKEKEEKDIPPTVGASYLVKLINLYGTSVKCSLWDVSGAEHFVDSLGHMFYRGAHVVIFLFDVTDIISFIFVKKLIEEVTTSEANTSLPILVGSKCDQHDKRQIQEAEVRTWADGKRIEYREVSACWASEKVQQLFYDIAEQGLKKMLGSSSSSLSSAASTAAQATSLPEWVPDSSGNSCTSCGADFHFSLRRHHCRRCGFIFCGPCSSQKVALPSFGLGPKPVRVCDQCYHVEHKMHPPP